MDQNNNVIEFPRNRRGNFKPSSQVSFDLEQRKVLISASLVSVFMLMSFLNQRIFKSKIAPIENSPSRGIASVETQDRRSNWEEALAKKLSKLKWGRTPANMGKAPSDLDKFSYETLGGNYIVRLGDGHKIKELVFSNPSDFENRPTLVKDRVQFLTQYKNLFIDFDSVSRIVAHEDQLGEKLELVKENKKVAIVDFRLDEYGHLMQLTVSQKTY